MIAKKRKRKLVFQGKVYYWHIRKDQEGYPKIHLSSEDKTIFLKYGFDNEMIIGPQYIEELLSKYLEEGKKSI